MSNIDEDLFEKTKKAYLTKIDLVFQTLFAFDEVEKCSDYLKSLDIPLQKIADEQQALSKKVNRISTNEEDSQKPISYNLIHSVKQSEMSRAIAFNQSGSIMVATCRNDIKVWKLDRENLVEQQRLTGHTDWVYCFAFSKRCNWFASGRDSKIQCWKEQANEDWENSKPQHQHTDSVTRLILNQNEDQLISCSLNNAIKVWHVNCQQNQIQFDYTLEYKHTDQIYCISLNKSETLLVSCSREKKIILWEKGENDKWQYKNHITNDDHGYRISFINDNQIIWQQLNKGFTHIFDIDNGKLIEKPDLKIILKEAKDDDWLFPTIFNKQKQIIIQKYDRYVYIIRRQSDSRFKIECEPIYCNHIQNFGALTENGEFLVIWDNETETFRVYQIKC